MTIASLKYFRLGLHRTFAKMDASLIGWTGEHSDPIYTITQCHFVSSAQASSNGSGHGLAQAPLSLLLLSFSRSSSPSSCGEEEKPKTSHHKPLLLSVSLAM